ncbi:hypothetical protein EII31_04275 [Leucobacter sp. OH2974_COT-288]|nr:hypothetical protein EII31_04275 [Leucobacter sp. OH2974_COT-288]
MRNNFGSKLFAFLTATILSTSALGSAPTAAAPAVAPTVTPKLVSSIPAADAVGTPHQTTPGTISAAINRTAQQLEKSEAQPASELRLTAAPTTPVLTETATSLTLRAELENTGESTSEPGVISLFVDPQPYVSRETFGREFPATALMVAQKSVPALNKKEKYLAEATISLEQLADLIAAHRSGGNDTTNDAAATSDSALSNGVYRVQALYTPRAATLFTQPNTTIDTDTNSSDSNNTANPGRDSARSSNAARGTTANSGTATATGETNVTDNNFIPVVPLPQWQPVPSGDPHPTITDAYVSTINNTTTDSVASDTAQRTAANGVIPGDTVGAVITFGAATRDSFAAATTVVYTGGKDPLPQTKLTTVVPLTLPEHVETLPTTEQLGELFAPETPLEQLLDFALENRATVAIDPRIIVSIRAAGDTAPDSAKTFLQRLKSPALSSFLLPYADSDLVTQQLLGLPQPLQPTGVTFALHESAQIPNAAITGNATETTAANQDTDPATVAQLSYEQLAAWDTTAPATVWFNPGTTSKRTLAAAHSAQANRVILNSAELQQHSGGPRVTLQDTEFNALVGSATLATAAQQISFNSPDSVTAQAAFANLYTELVHSGEVVLLADRSLSNANMRTVRMLQAIHDTSFVTAVPAGQLTGGTATLQDDISPAAAAAFEIHKPLLQAALKNEKTVLHNAPALTQPQKLIDYQRSRLLQLFNTAHLGSSANKVAAFETLAAAYQDRDTALRSSIQILAPQRTQILGVEAKLPLQIRNSLPFAINVLLQLESGSDTLSVTQQEFKDLTVESGDTITVLAPVHSNTGAGAGSVITHLLTADGAHNLTTETFSLGIASYVETIGLAAMGFAVAVLLAVWLRRLLQKSRAATAGSQ